MSVISIVAVVVLAASPIRLEEVREQSRKSVRALQAELDRQRAAEQVSLARSALLPQVDLSSAAGGALSGPQRYYTALPGPSGVTLRAVDVPASSRGNYSLGVSVSQLLYDAGKWAQLGQAGASAQAAAGQAFEERMASELEGIRRFYALLRAQRALEVLEKRARGSQAQLDSSRAMFAAGRRRKEDVLGATVNLGKDRILILQQRAQIAAARADLATWLARPATEPLEAMDPGTLGEQVAAPPSVERALQVARERRPLIGALEAQARAAEEGVRVARAGFWPRLSAKGGYDRNSPTVDPFFTDPTRQNSIYGSVNVSWNLFDGFATVAQVREAEHARARARLSYEQADREIAAEVEKALEALVVQAEVAQVARENLALAQEALSLAEERFRAGVSTSVEVRDAQDKLTDAELTLLDSRIEVEIARAALERAMGTLT